MIRGKIATVFHGIDVSHRDVLCPHYTPEYQQLFERGDLIVTHQQPLGRTFKKYGVPAAENRGLAHGDRYDALYAPPVEIASRTAGDYLCRPG